MAQREDSRHQDADREEGPAKYKEGEDDERHTSGKDSHHKENRARMGKAPDKGRRQVSLENPRPKEKQEEAQGRGDEASEDRRHTARRPGEWVVRIIRVISHVLLAAFADIALRVPFLVKHILTAIQGNPRTRSNGRSRRTDTRQNQNGQHKGTRGSPGEVIRTKARIEDQRERQQPNTIHPYLGGKAQPGQDWKYGVQKGKEIMLSIG